MASRRSSKDLVISICQRVRAESTRNKRLTLGATESVLNHLVNDTAEALSQHGQARISGLGRFEVSERTGDVRFYPYEKFLAQLELSSLYNSGDLNENENESDEL